MQTLQGSQGQTTEINILNKSITSHLNNQTHLNPAPQTFKPWRDAGHLNPPLPRPFKPRMCSATPTRHLSHTVPPLTLENESSSDIIFSITLHGRPICPNTTVGCHRHPNPTKSRSLKLRSNQLWPRGST